jgi:hypothetical protein
MDTLTAYFLNINLNKSITFPSVPKFSNRSLPLRFSDENIKHTFHVSRSRDNSVGIALGYGLNDQSSKVRFPAGAGNFSLHHRIQNGSVAHPASYPMDTRGSSPGGKAVGV